jgi:SAM-dependent methyltransferase
MAPDFQYAGGELELFAQAANWKGYFQRRLAPYVRGDVLEVGSGIGGTTRILCRGSVRSWTCLEPDARLQGEAQRSFAKDSLPIQPRLIGGTLAELPAAQKFDAILYVDVLEHIEDDAAELRRAAGHLKAGGCVVVLAPAHQVLFTPFDEAIGHFRRYNRRRLRSITPGTLRVETLFYLDSVGLLASLANRCWLRSSMPTPGQIRVWDRCMVPVSRWLDPLFAYRLGKSVVGIWRPAGAV